MIFIGELEDLAAEYRSTWSGLCRGNPRIAYKIEAGGPILRSDFIRWIGRWAIKNRGEKMILRRTINRDGLIVLVFQNTEKEGEKKTVEQMVAEAVVELGKDGQGVPCSGIHFAAFGHPFSASQRLREMKDKFLTRASHGAIPDGHLGDLPYYNDVEAYRFVKAENKYYFSRDFISWLRQEYIDKARGKCSD